MNQPGDSEPLSDARSALLDALEALSRHRSSVVVVGAQAIYLHAGRLTNVALAELTLDGDLALDTRSLGPDPVLDEAMTSAGFKHDESDQPGSWRNEKGIAVDLMVPESLAGAGGRRGARIPPHSKHSARRVTGLEAAVVDHAPMEIGALPPRDRRPFTVSVASPAALLVAKLHKLGDRVNEARQVDNKDAHDIYRLLMAIPTNDLASSLRVLAGDPIAGPVTRTAIQLLRRLFINGSPPVGAHMAGQAEQFVGEPEVVTAAVMALSRDLLDVVEAE